MTDDHHRHNDHDTGPGQPRAHAEASEGDREANEGPKHGGGEAGPYQDYRHLGQSKCFLMHSLKICLQSQSAFIIFNILSALEGLVELLNILLEEWPFRETTEDSSAV